MRIADYLFPVSIFRWKFEEETITITEGAGINDLEYPEYTKLFLSDYRNQYVNYVLKENGKIIEEQPWSFDSHPGWRIFEEHDGARVELRVFVVRNRFYTIGVGIHARQQFLNERQQQILASFHPLSVADWVDERERLIDLLTPPPLPQQSPVGRLQSDAEEENLRGNVKRVLVEEALYLGQSQPRARQPVTRKDFDQKGYLVGRVEYADYLPWTVATYGYLNGSRVYRQSLLLSFPEHCAGPGAGPKQSITLYRMQRKYGKTGMLEEIRTSDEDGGVAELYSYQTKQHRLRISFRQGSRYSKDPRLKWKSVVELDAEGNPIGEKRTAYYELPDSGFVMVEKPVDVHGVISGAIKGQVIPPPDGRVTRHPSVTDVAKNPNITEKSFVRIDADSTKKSGVSNYAYTYEYDSHRNWIRRTTFLVKKSGDSTTRVPIKETYRTIAYH